MNINLDMDSVVTRRLLDKVRKYAHSPRKAVQASLFAFDRLIRNTFQKQTDPWGDPWVDLKDTTWAARRRRGITSKAKLIATAEMFRSLDRNVDSDNRGHISMGTDDRPVIPHLLGAQEINLPARPMMPIKPPGVIDMPEDWKREVEGHLFESLEKEVRE